MDFQTLSKPENRWIPILILTATALSGAIALFGISQLKSPEKPAEVATAQATPSVQQVAALGRLEPTTEVAKVSVPAALARDRVAELRVKRGDRVKAGEVIAVLESRDRLQNAVLEAQAQVKVAQAELAQVRAGAKSGEIAAQDAEVARLQKELEGETIAQQATVDRWQAEVRTADADFTRYSSLYREGVIGASELDQRRLNAEKAQSQLNEAIAQQSKQIETLQEQIRQARATLSRIAEVRPVDVQLAQAGVERAVAAVSEAEANLAEAYIRAPISGQILEIDAKAGEVVGDEGIAALGQTNQMQVVTEVYQTDISKIQVGQPATITSESFAGELRGTVSLIGLQVIQQEVQSGEPGENLDRKVIQVWIQLNPDDSQQVASLTNLQVQVAIQPTESSAQSQ
jgi:HlyD family secretion protein